MQIDQENKHTVSLPHLSGPEKEAIMREKYLASMKPVCSCSLSITCICLSIIATCIFIGLLTLHCVAKQHGYKTHHLHRTF